MILALTLGLAGFAFADAKPDLCQDEAKYTQQHWDKMLLASTSQDDLCKDYSDALMVWGSKGCDLGLWAYLEYGSDQKFWTMGMQSEVLDPDRWASDELKKFISKAAGSGHHPISTIAASWNAAAATQKLKL